MVQFNEDVTKFLNDAYEGRDAVQRRSKCLAQLNIIGGETVLDLGCGAGHFTVELARAVGPKGKVIGLDPSTSMLESAQQKVTGRGNVELLEGYANAINLPDQSIDRIAAIQVFSYLSDLLPALGEARRVLKPNGIMVVSDIHWGGAIWSSKEPELGRKAVEFWKSQLKSPDTPEILPALAVESGFSHCHIVPVPVVDSTLRPDGLAQMLMILIEKCAVQSEDSELIGDITKWKDEQLNRAASGQFFFSVTNFITVLS